MLSCINWWVSIKIVCSVAISDIQNFKFCHIKLFRSYSSLQGSLAIYIVMCLKPCFQWMSFIRATDVVWIDCLMLLMLLTIEQEDPPGEIR